MLETSQDGERCRYLVFEGVEIGSSDFFLLEFKIKFMRVCSRAKYVLEVKSREEGETEWQYEERVERHCRYLVLDTVLLSIQESGEDLNVCSSPLTRTFWNWSDASTLQIH